MTLMRDRCGVVCFKARKKESKADRALVYQLLSPVLK